MKDARNQNTSGVLAAKDNVPAAFHSTKAGTNIVTRYRGLAKIANRFLARESRCAAGPHGESASYQAVSGKREKGAVSLRGSAVTSTFPHFPLKTNALPSSTPFPRATLKPA